MSKIKLLYRAIHEFKPAGQDKALEFLKQNREILKQHYGFTKIPQILVESKQLDTFEKELLDKDFSIVDIIKDIIRQSFPQKTRDDLKNIYDKHYVKSYIESANNNFVDLLKDNFTTKKTEIAEFFYKKDFTQKFCLPLLDAHIQPNQVSKILSEYFILLQEEASKKIENILKKCNAKKMWNSIPFEFEKEHFRISGEVGDEVLKLYKILLQKPSDKKVALIEKIIKTKYDLDFVHLDNYEDAMNIYKALKIASKNKSSIPKNIVVAPSEINNAGSNYKNSNGNNTILITPSYLLRKNLEDGLNGIEHNKIKRFFDAATKFNELTSYSTQASSHVALHEILHTNKIFPIYTIPTPLPQKFEATINNLSQYAQKQKNRNVEEIKVELLTKKLLQGLKQDEEELLEYIIKTYTVPLGA